MKKQSHIYFKVGLFVVTATFLFTTGIYLLGRQKNLFGNNFRLNAIFNNVGGLQVGNNVRFSGINVGTVENISFINDTSVIVIMVIDGKVKKFIRNDARAIIGSEGLMGDKLVNILPGSPAAHEVKDNETIATSKSVDIDQIMTRLQETTKNSAVITGDLADILDNIHEGRGAIGALLMDRSFANDFKQTIVNVKKGTGGFSENMEAAKHSFFLRGFFKKKKEKEEKEKAEHEKPAKQDEGQTK